MPRVCRRPLPDSSASAAAPSALAARLAGATIVALALGASGPLSATESLTVTLADRDGETVGEARLDAVGGGVLIDARLRGLAPGVHGFHLHESGECDPADGFKSAGGHLAGDAEHGFLVDGGPHPGDMPNIHVPDSGELAVEVLNTRVALASSGPGALLDEDGSALVIHAGADDYQSQPAGDAGERIACAEIAGGGG